MVSRFSRGCRVTFSTCLGDSRTGGSSVTEGLATGFVMDEARLMIGALKISAVDCDVCTFPGPGALLGLVSTGWGDLGDAAVEGAGATVAFGEDVG